MNMTTVRNSSDTTVDISVVIPSYNHASFIVEAIESIVRQTFSNWELILIDDGSTDNTRSILDQRYRDNKKIRLVYQENHGAHHALNLGVRLARGRYISILNSDDVYHPHRLQTLFSHCNTSVCGLIFTPVTPIDTNGNEILASAHSWCYLYAKLMSIYRQRGAGEALLTGNFAVTSSNFFISTTLIKQLGGFRKKRYNHDWDLMARAILQGIDIYCVGHESLLSYRIHDGNTITQNTLRARLELKQILQSLVPKGEPYFAKLVLQMQTNMRSIRHEHQVRVLQRVRDGYDTHIQKILNDLQVQHQQVFFEQQEQHQKTLSDLHAKYQGAVEDLEAQHAVQIDVLNQTQHNLLLQIGSQERFLALIQNSRSYQFAQFLSRSFNGIKRLLGLLK